MRKTVIYIASSGRNVGKTSISIGFFKHFADEGKKTAFVKPVAQHYNEIGGYKISRDAILMKKIYNFIDEQRLNLVSPFVIESGFTKAFIRGEVSNPKEHIKRSFYKILEEYDAVIVEGTGHPGVGSCIGLSNAYVAKILGANTVLILEGGIGNTIDNYHLAKSAFRSAGCSIDAVIVNKVKQEKYDEIDSILRKFFRNEDVYYLGTIPYVKELSMPSLKLITDRISGKVLQREDLLAGKISDLIMALNEPHIFLEELENASGKNIILTSGDREDILMTIYALYERVSHKIQALILTTSEPHPRILELYKNLAIPIIFTPFNIFKTATMISEINVKIDPYETEKISTLQDLFYNYIEESQLKKFTVLSTREFKKRDFWTRIKEITTLFKHFFKP